MQYPHLMLSLIGIIRLNDIVAHAPLSVFTGTTELIISQHARPQLCEGFTETGCEALLKLVARLLHICCLWWRLALPFCPHFLCKLNRKLKTHTHTQSQHPTALTMRGRHYRKWIEAPIAIKEKWNNKLLCLRIIWSGILKSATNNL